jgi:hypothetical protein
LAHEAKRVEQFEAHLVRTRRCLLGKSNREYPSHSWPHEPKFFQFSGRFPRYHRDVPAPVLDFLAKQLGIEPAVWFDYDLKGRSSKRDREQVRTFLGFRPITLDDEEPLHRWLEHEVVPKDTDERHLRAALLDWCRAHRLEPPTDSSADRIIASAVHAFEDRLFAQIHDQLSATTRERLDALLVLDEETEPNDDPSWAYSAFHRLKSDPGRIGLASVEREIAKLALIDELNLPAELWQEISPKLLTRYRARAATESARELRRHRPPVRYALLSAYCWQRRRELIDGLVDLLILLIHRLSVRAEKRITTEMLGELKPVEDKTGILFRIAEAALENPDGSVREVLFPLIGESTLAALVEESQAKAPTFRHRVQRRIHRSYGHHYRRMLPLILSALVFRSNNSHRPVIDALTWLNAHREGRRNLIPCAEIPVVGVVSAGMQEALIEDGPDGERINRIDYEICVLQVLRERLRCKEIWVEGADRFRNPDEDLPADFEAKRARASTRPWNSRESRRSSSRPCNGRCAMLSKR